MASNSAQGAQEPLNLRESYLLAAQCCVLLLMLHDLLVWHKQPRHKPVVDKVVDFAT